MNFKGLAQKQISALSSSLYMECELWHKIYFFLKSEKNKQNNVAEFGQFNSARYRFTHSNGCV